ncbi:SDR family oxidoreductase [Hymenobacter sp. RP-2-7]|uniref:SDR family oxidoreductase n=1 Tax=Hymenobacter polaris TaxID=2682546 RepID=A0A7Y0FLM7_9BACT|nr:SDR family oxidoreductase [Hymenobacter polaris]NML64576.1 SDR family oxidoreductase [Hymenobacter polaris]
MSVKLKPLHQQVLVITGATSGIGLATARQAAKAGARLVLAARSANDLETVARELGGHVATVVADVADPVAVAHIADTARSHFGGFDTWVNNAGVGMWGKIEQGNLADFKRLYDTNLWGVVNGSLEAIKFLKQHGGALINLGSVASDVAIPFQGMYASSKHAIKGFTDALRIELGQDKAPVSVTLIKPAAINTPFPAHARNYLPEQPTLPPPVYAPEEVGSAILHAASHPVRDIYVGGGGKMMSVMNKYAPGTVDWLASKTSAQQQVHPGTRARHPEGSLQRPTAPHLKARGDYEGHTLKTYYTPASLHPVVAGLVAATTLGASLALWMGRDKTPKPAEDGQAPGRVPLQPSV